MNLHRILERASQLHARKEFTEADKLYRQVISADPRNSDALHLRGILLHQTGKSEEGIKLIRRAIMTDGRVPQYHENLANVYSETGHFERAAESLRSVIELEPKSIAPRIRLARFLNAELNRPPEAVTVLRQVLALEPDNAEAMADIAVALHRSNDKAAALEFFEKAMAHTPDDPDLLCNYATTLNELGQYDRALPLFERGLAAHPRHEKLWFNLGLAYLTQSRVEDAIAALKQAIECNPNYASAKFHLSLLLCADGQLEESAEVYCQAIDNPNERPKAINTVAAVRLSQGRVDEAIALYRRVLALDPNYQFGWNDLLLALQYHPSDDPAKLIAEHRAWGRLHENRCPIHQHKNDRSPDRRLRIGYVSADFRTHSVSFFLEPILANHDKSRFEIFCYANQYKTDNVTERLKGYGHHWRDIYGKSDETAAELIQQDQIDILVDLSLHTGGNRLLVFARKPAPIQGTYLGYAGTSGLPAMDFRFTDSWIDPIGTSDVYNSEQLIRLPDTQWVYRPPSGVPDVGPLPAEKAGHITFGIATNLAKVNMPTIELWSQVMRAVSGSVLLIKGAGLSDAAETHEPGAFPVAQYRAKRFREIVYQQLKDLFAQSGIAEDQLRMEGRSSLEGYFDWFSRVDLTLDTFPFAGGTTTCHSLYMGVPVVTRTGRTSVSKVGSSALHNVGLGELVAGTPKQFFLTATDLANDLRRLAEIRRTLRQSMKQSPLMNEPRFVANLETAYRQMWRQRISQEK